MLLFEDDYLIAVNKPVNTLVHHSKMANNIFEEKSLVQILQSTFKLKAFPIHRLDRKTSGIILFSKKKEHVFTFQQLFNQNKINKIYYAVVRGFTPEKGVIDSDVKGRDSNTYKSALTIYNRVNKIVLPIAVTPYETSRYSLVRLEPKTGRLHQLRIHTNKISHPIVGDPKYGDRFHNRMFEKEFNINEMFLHAQSIEFKHPITNKLTKIESDFPIHWKKILNEFKWNI